MEKIKTSKLIIVEGKYDKIKLESVIDGTIMTTGGFSIFNNDEKCALIRKLADKRGIVIITDSDGAGLVIRNKLKSVVADPAKIINLYIPQIKGKESRKTAPSKQGFLGVEGIDAGLIRDIFQKAGIEDAKQERNDCAYTKTDLYMLGYSGRDDSAHLRDSICKSNGLPSGMSANAFLEAVNILQIKL